MHANAQRIASIHDYTCLLGKIRSTLRAVGLRCRNAPSHVAEILVARAMQRAVSLIMQVMLTW